MKPTFMSEFFDRLPYRIIGTLLFLLPLFFLPTTEDFYEFNKQMLLAFTTSILLIVFAIDIVRRKKIDIITSPLDFPLLTLILLSLFSTIFQSPYKMGSLLASTGPAMLFIFSTLYFITVYYRDDENPEKENPLWIGILGGATCLGIIVILWSLGLVTNPLSNPMGTPFLALLFLIVSITIALVKFRNSSYKIIYLLPIIVSISAILILISFFLKNGLTILPIPIGLSIAFSTFKSIPQFLLGIGPGNFLTSFTLGRPAELNHTSLWNLTFTSSSSFILTLATEIGPMAALIFLYLIVRTFARRVLYLLLMLGIFCFGLSNTALTTVLFVLLALSTKKRERFTINLSTVNKLAWIIPSIIFIWSIVQIYFVGRIYLAEIMHKQGLDAIATNKGQEVYDKIAASIRRNKYVDRYHRSFSQVNVALANSISAKEKKTDEDIQNIPRLVQQAIDEARVATSLYPTNVFNWNNLGNIYLSISSYAQGADQKAIEAYQQQITLSPTDPQARFTLGNVYFSLKKYDEAITLFDQTIRLKPEWANAHYNLANTYKEIKNYPKTLEELEKTKSLLPKKSPNREKVEKEIKKIKEYL